MEATKETKFGTKVAYEDEDDARTSNTCIVQRKHAKPCSVINNNRNIIECCNNTYQGHQVCACALDLGDCSHVSCTYNTYVSAILLYYYIYYWCYP